MDEEISTYMGVGQATVGAEQAVSGIGNSHEKPSFSNDGFSDLLVKERKMDKEYSDCTVNKESPTTVRQSQERLSNISGSSFPGDWSEWSMLNSPEFSVHSFHVPHDAGSATCSREVEESEIIGRKSSLGDTISQSDTFGLEAGSTMWYIDSPLLDETEQSNSLPIMSNNSATSSPGMVLPVSRQCNGAQNCDDSSTSKSLKKEAEISDSSDSSDIKTSIMSAWNNMKNGFTVQMKTNFKYDCPLWIMGKVYHSTKEDKDRQKIEHSLGKSFITPMDLFKLDFASKIWFTYRKDFACLPYSSLTTDMGWGCMLRTGQMMLAHAFVLHLLNRDWRHRIHKSEDDQIHLRILKFFNDKESRDCPFSIHRLIKVGKRYDKLPGDWYGPSSVAYVLRDAITESEGDHPLLSNLCLYVAQDLTVYIGDLLELCSQQPSQAACDQAYKSNNRKDSSSLPSPKPNYWRSVIILIPIRLGGLDMNKVYAPCVKSFLAHDMCIGIIGGKPKHSLYFVGWQEDKLIYLDPHFCQDFIDCDSPGFNANSFHCNDPRKMSIDKMDPSCTIGFYCKTKEDFFKFVKEAQQITAPPNQPAPYPMFIFHHGRSEDTVNKDCDPDKGDRILKVRHYDSEGRKLPLKKSDDFVFL